jgi:hypothetical protein
MRIALECILAVVVCLSLSLRVASRLKKRKTVWKPTLPSR